MGVSKTKREETRERGRGETRRAYFKTLNFPVWSNSLPQQLGGTLVTLPGKWLRSLAATSMRFQRFVQRETAAPRRCVSRLQAFEFIVDEGARKCHARNKPFIASANGGPPGSNRNGEFGVEKCSRDLQQFVDQRNEREWGQALCFKT